MLWKIHTKGCMKIKFFKLFFIGILGVLILIIGHIYEYLNPWYSLIIILLLFVCLFILNSIEDD